MTGNLSLKSPIILMCIFLLMLACNPLAVATPDRVATGVAEAQAIAATLTAAAPKPLAILHAGTNCAFVKV